MRFDSRILLAGVAAVSVIAVLVVAAIVFLSGDDNPSADEVTQKVAAALDQPGMVYHAQADDGTEVWLDFAGQKYRRQETTSDGTLISVGDGWERTSFDPFNNKLLTEDLSPSGDARPRIDNPAARWTDALAALAFGNQLTYVGRTFSGGREVIALQADSPIIGEGDVITGTLSGRIEIDPDTYFPVAFERRTTFADGTTPTPNLQGQPVNKRIVYTTTEMLPADSLAADFFDKSVVDDQVLTVEENLAQIREQGLAPLWLGDPYLGDLGVLRLPEADNIVVVSAEERAEIHYSYIIQVSATTGQPLTDAVIIRLAKDASTFTPPVIPEYGGDLPEQRDAVTVRGADATLYTSLLTPADLPCAGTCPPTLALLYRRLVFTVGDTAVQIETAARVDETGAELNKYNTRDGIIALAEALVEAQ